MSNFGWAWPKDDWHQGVRDLCDKYGTLLCYDETHTISQGPGGMAGHLGIQGDLWTCGKCISSGIPGAVYGMTGRNCQKALSRPARGWFFYRRRTRISGQCPVWQHHVSARLEDHA